METAAGNENDGAAVQLLRRCRFALAVGAPEWETDVETAMESDAQLVRDIDALLEPREEQTPAQAHSSPTPP